MIYAFILMYIFMSIPFWVSIFVFEEVNAILELIIFTVLFILVTSVLSQGVLQHKIAKFAVQHLERRYQK